MKNEVKVVEDSDLIKTLQSSLYVGAKPESIMMVIDYCKARNLDPLQKPVHIVPMYDHKSREMRDVIMQGIGHYRTQAERSNSYAGITEPEFGEERAKDGFKFPQWCKITVKRLLKDGSIGEFTAKEFWLENYAIKGGKEKDQSPNAMWTKRPYGQLAKCTEAQALRKAFPDLLGAEPTFEEMEGKSIDYVEVVSEVEMPKSKKEKPVEEVAKEVVTLPPTDLEAAMVACTTIEEIHNLFPRVDALEAGEEKDHLMIIGKTKFKELKKSAK